MKINEVKVRRIGNSKVFTIPKSIHITTDDYVVFQGRHGDIVYAPKRKNVFDDEGFIKAHDWSQREEFSDTLKGLEGRIL
ncbi:antitoxin of toxin-antitoxin stability system [Companilactobacillus suantsaicola]|uniref:Antitoxin of toxin-antitoxin stability system n=1 Tax=Companilactobacillus suantsaicola TaxID=2487723 RepID=A0A4Z0JHU3_9LACO|nr:antitoxin of toxin-antitoxin stability system [Companilactobacillus suantsaicola]TGD21628.1 antitoxin of toxin-antitoxin stability system [Companilactobacillus suantsaicola]